MGSFKILGASLAVSAGLVLGLASSLLGASHALADIGRTYVVDPENAGAPAQIKDEALKSNPTGRMLRTPTFGLGSADSEPAVKVSKTVVYRYVPKRLRFNRISVNGYPVQPRVKFARDAEIFQGGRIRDESIRADFFGKVADDLSP